jgi:hypothetical protein
MKTFVFFAANKAAFFVLLLPSKIPKSWLKHWASRSAPTGMPGQAKAAQAASPNRLLPSKTEGTYPNTVETKKACKAF